LRARLIRAAPASLAQPGRRLALAFAPGSPALLAQQPGATRPLQPARREQTSVHVDIAGLSPRRISAEVIGAVGILGLG
jgi:hypothetical protein